MVGGVSPPFGVSGSLLDQGDQRVDRPAALALESDDDGIDLQLVDLGVLQGDGDDPADAVLHGVDIGLGQSPRTGHQLVCLGGLDHLVQLLLGHGCVGLGDLSEDLHVDSSETEGDDGSELRVADHGEDDLLSGDHLLDRDSDDVRAGHVLGAGVHDLGVGGLGLVGVLDTDDDSSDIGLVLDVGGHDLHDHGVSDLVAGGCGIVGAVDEGLSGGGDAVCGEDLLTLGLGERVPALGLGFGQDLLGGLVSLHIGDLHRGRGLVQVLGVSPEHGQRVDGPVGCGVRGHLAGLEDGVGPVALNSSGEAHDGGHGDVVLHVDDDLGDALEVSGVQRGSHDDEPSDLRVPGHDVDDLLEVLGLRVSTDVDGVGESGDGGNTDLDLLDGLLGELDGVHVGSLECGVRGHDTETSGVGDDGDSVLLHRAAAAEHAEGVEHVVQVVGPVDVELVEDDVVDGIGSGEGPGVGGRGGGSGLGPSALEDHDGLLDLGVLDLLHELLTVGDSLAVHSQDLGLGVFHDIVDYVGFSPDGYATAEEGFFRFLDMYLATGEVTPLSAVVIDDFRLSAYADHIGRVAEKVNSSTEESYALYRAILSDDFTVVDAVSSIAIKCYMMLRNENFFTHRIQYPVSREYMLLPSAGQDADIKYIEYSHIYVH